MENIMENIMVNMDTRKFTDLLDKSKGCCYILKQNALCFGEVKTY